MAHNHQSERSERELKQLQAALVLAQLATTDKRGYQPLADVEITFKFEDLSGYAWFTISGISTIRDSQYFHYPDLLALLLFFTIDQQVSSISRIENKSLYFELTDSIPPKALD